MSKAKFAAAKELIDEKKFSEARAVLKTIDHPTAREWEARLDKIDPPLNPPESEWFQPPTTVLPTIKPVVKRNAFTPRNGDQTKPGAKINQVPSVCTRSS